MKNLFRIVHAAVTGIGLLTLSAQTAVAGQATTYFNSNVKGQLNKHFSDVSDMEGCVAQAMRSAIYDVDGHSSLTICKGISGESAKATLGVLCDRHDRWGTYPNGVGCSPIPEGYLSDRQFLLTVLRP